MNPSLIEQGVELMVYGMGTVFVFLIVLVFSTTLMSLSLRKYAIAETQENAPTVSGDIDSNVRAAIKAAIHLHRHRKK